jgi:hypothetical protein
LPTVPLANGETWGYLYPGLSWLSGLAFQQTYEREWLILRCSTSVFELGYLITSLCSLFHCKLLSLAPSLLPA